LSFTVWNISVLYREPKLLKQHSLPRFHFNRVTISVLYREPKLLKLDPGEPDPVPVVDFSALP
jgi:hypothetical protein